MKRLFVILALTITSGSAFGAAVTITVTERVETPVAIGRTVLIEETDGSKTLVQLENLADDKYNLRLVAYGKGGKVLVESKAMRAREGEALSIESAVRNGAGELVVLTNYSRDSATNGKLYSDNLTRNTSALIAQGASPRLIDRIRVGNKNLALVSTDLGHGPGDEDNSLVRMIDEDTANVFSQTFLSHSVSGKLGLNSRNQVVAILMGYELFGLLDTQSGNFTALIPERQQPSQYPGQLHLPIGDFITLGDENSFRLLDTAALFDGRVQEVRSFTHQPAFLGDYVVERKPEGLVVSELRFGSALGPALADEGNGRAQTSVDSVTNTPRGLIAVTTRFKIPNSFMPGAILEYVNVATGEVLRTTENGNYGMTGKILVKGDRVFALEVRQQGGMKAAYELVDLATGKIVSQGTDLLLGAAYQLESGRILSLKANEQKQVCVIDLENPADASCIQDPLVQPDAIRYGYDPLKIGEKNGQLRLPLIGGRDASRLQNRGYLELQITE